jgi:hypothetical protein
MKKILFYFPVFILFFSCSGEQGTQDDQGGDSTQATETNWVSLDLSGAEIQAKMDVPDGVTVKAMKWETIIGDAKWFEQKETKSIMDRVKIKPGFGIEINEDESYSIAERKAFVESNDVNKLEKFINIAIDLTQNL